MRLSDLIAEHPRCLFVDSVTVGTSLPHEIDSDVTHSEVLGAFTITRFRLDGERWYLLCGLDAHRKRPEETDYDPRAA